MIYHDFIYFDLQFEIVKQYKYYGDELALESLGKIHLEPVKMICYDVDDWKNSRPSKHQSLQNLGEFISINHLEDNLTSVSIPAVRIHRNSKYFGADYARNEIDI